MSLRIPFVSRRGRDKDTRARVPDSAVPWWVSVFTDVGRPVAAIVVLVLCAPGEQHLARLAGWSERLSWGMAGLFSMYAGIAAVVATVRPKGAPGKNSAVWGAVISLLLAMGAQPVSHLFVTGWLSAEPRAPWILVMTVSCVPPFILGHLLHLAASPSGRTAGQPDTARTGQAEAPRPAPSRTEADRTPQWLADNRTAADSAGQTVSGLMSAVLGSPDTRSTPDNSPDAMSVSFSRTPVPVRPARTPRPAVSLDKEDMSGEPVPSLADKRNMSARALVLALDGQDTDSIKATLRREFPTAKADSVRKAAGRAVDKASAAS